jgi:hypothetical protein
MNISEYPIANPQILNISKMKMETIESPNIQE